MKAVILLLLLSCAKEGYEHKYFSYKVIKVLGCSNATSDAWAGRKEGKCKVLLSDNSIKTINSPTGIGDIVRVLKEVKKESGEQ